jgi:hypothetical protein
MVQIADAAFDAFAASYERAPQQRTGMARHIVVVTLLTISEKGWAVDHWLEATIERFRTATDMAYMTFAKTASNARALIHHGAVDGVPLLSLLPTLREADDPAQVAGDLVARLNVNDALRRRVWRKAIGLEKPETLMVLPHVEELMIRSEQGDQEALSELMAIQKLLGSWDQPNR